MKAFLICLLGLLVHLTHAALQCEKMRIKTCAARYKKAVKNGQGHCDRLQTMIDCLAEEPSCNDITITSFRFWMLQMGEMDNIIQKCVPNVRTGVLKDLTAIFTSKHPNLFTNYVDKDGPSKCAKDIHDKCVNGYLRELKKKRNICTAIDALNKCYSDYITADNCHANIIQHFEGIVKSVAPRVIRVLKKHLPIVCREWPFDSSST